ncbi:MAG: TIGR03936 family radical SAM-associated protein [Sphaerochaetaceae bacterium]|nr:TIGR03936 family radical SAM-associated protein [Sphaerochaetaceae bacterium]
MIDLEKQLGNGFLEIENPARYIGSEYIYNQKHYKEGMIKCAMCFPDLYEIGMANNAIRILYDLINRIPEAVCDRVFAVAPDFEALLRSKNIPLFTLQEQFPLSSLDYLGISIGYELSATNILQILDLGGIELDAKDRKETDPIVIAGGPAATNPLPFSRFFDFVHIGEAEADIADIIRIIGEHKTRSERIQALKSIPYLWYPGKEMAKRAVDTTFGTPEECPVLEHFAISSFETAQDHGTVEIMRGCPNGCRFCHAGQYYKPFRQRNLDTVYDLVEQNVSQLGYREITLSSLSSGDYPGLDKLIKALNESYKARSISFSLPSLRVSTFGLNIIEQLSEVRKSGLTFAIETPLLQNQRSNNKEVPLESVISIIQEARSRGWKLAKFYFMVGLPFVDVETEQQSLVDFLLAIRNATKINMNINIGTFIPKAHTPYQWVRQMTMEESARHLRSIKKALMDAIPGIKVSYHEPSISFLEGLVSRGGYECCDLIQKAYELGCRLDAWDEYIRWDLWQKAIEELSYDTSPRSWDLEDELPWDSVSMNVSKAYLKREYEKASRHELTHICDSDCDHRCGVCSKSGAKVIQANNEDFSSIRHPVHVLPPASEYVQAILTYEKTGRAVYNSHIAVMRQFEMAFQRAGLDVMFTQGFNPKPKMEFLNPISMGVCGENELLLCELPISQITPDTVNVLNKALADGFNVKSIKVLPPNPTGKKISLSSKMKGSVFEISDIEDDEIRGILDTQAGSGTSDFMLERIGEGCYRVTVFGDKNIFKLLFPKEMSKFHIAGSCHIVRKHIDMERI